MSIACEIRMNSAMRHGSSAPLGATLKEGGVNFSIYSRHASAVEVLLFDDEDDSQPSRVFTFDPVANRTYHYWHAFVPEVRAGQIYGYRIDGPSAPDKGLLFDPACVLLDPYGRGVVIPEEYNRRKPDSPEMAVAAAMKSVVVDPADYDWEGDEPLRRSSSRTIVYEMHVRGFTRHPSSGVAEFKRGTYAGLIEKIPYLRELGVTAVELLPVFQFDALDCPPGNVNYWGYAPVSFFAPHRAFSSRKTPLGPVDEFRDMVKALHRAGIEVILDVVYNHTAEGDQNGPTICFRGVDNPTYYILENGGSRYANYTGCGNTFNANQPIVRRLIVDSLRYWVEEMHVDGFRFDLASILSRDASGASDSESAGVVGHRIGPRARRDEAVRRGLGCRRTLSSRLVCRRFVEGMERAVPRRHPRFSSRRTGSLGRAADRLVGSHEIYGHKQREAEQSLNFVTCHDGFTLNDLVSYNDKHNEANGEQNRDGANDNRSWNHGVEGPTDDPAIEKLRNRQVKNAFTLALMSLGVPMFVMGDEVRRTQDGNNNAYCQDNETSWLDWTLLDKHADVRRFVSLLIARRALRDEAHEHKRMSLSELLAQANKAWHGVKLLQPDWGENSHSIALGAELKAEGIYFHLILNGHWTPLDFELPDPQAGGHGPWRRWIDTGLDSPCDIVPWQQAITIAGDTYRAQDRSVVMLIADRSSTNR